MTYSPLTIGFASMIPGLGFWLLGQRQRAIVIGMIVFGLLFISFLFLGEPIGQFFAQLFLLLWLVQLIFAVQIARTHQKQRKGEIEAPQPVSPFRKPATKLSGTQASEYYSRELAKGQLQSGEHMIKSFIGKKHISLGMTALTGGVAALAVRWYCVAFTQSTLLLIELDFLWKPSSVKRLPYSDVVTAHYKTGWLSTDRIGLDFGNGKTLDLDVAHTFRKSAQAIVSIFEKMQLVKPGGG